jgi:hypothetical protein
MAKILEAVRDYGPEVKLNSPVSLRDFCRFLSMRTSMTNGQVQMMLSELNEAISYFNNQGTPVNLPGIGRFAPSIDRHGNFRIKVNVDKSLPRQINEPGAFTGRVENKQNIGLNNEGYKVLWDTDHPDNPLVI